MKRKTNFKDVQNNFKKVELKSMNFILFDAF